MDNQYDTQFFQNPQQPKPTYVYIPYGFTPETFEERRKVIKIANIIGIALLIALAVGDLAVPLLRSVFTIFDLWNSTAIAFIADPAFNQLFNAIFSVLTFTLPFILVFKLSKRRISSLIRFKIPKREDIIPYTLIGVGFCAAANIAVSYFGSIFSLFGINYDVDFGESPEGFFGFMLTFIATAVIPPLVEEFAFRGIILGSLRKISDPLAIFISSVLFGLMHGNFQQMPFAFMVGLCLGFVTVKTNSIWLAVAIHAANNTVSVVFDYLVFGSDEIKSVIYLAYLSFAIILGIFGVYILGNRKGSFKIKAKETSAKTGQIIKWFLTSPAIMIFIAICIVDSFQYFV